MILPPNFIVIVIIPYPTFNITLFKVDYFWFPFKVSAVFYSTVFSLRLFFFSSSLFSFFFWQFSSRIAFTQVLRPFFPLVMETIGKTRTNKQCTVRRKKKYKVGMHWIGKYQHPTSDNKSNLYTDMRPNERQIIKTKNDKWFAYNTHTRVCVITQ